LRRGGFGGATPGICGISGLKREGEELSVIAGQRFLQGLNQPERKNEERSYARRFSLHCTDELAKGATREERITEELRERNECLGY
jgi:hypothetical protein